MESHTVFVGFVCVGLTWSAELDFMFDLSQFFGYGWGFAGMRWDSIGFLLFVISPFSGFDWHLVGGFRV